MIYEKSIYSGGNIKYYIDVLLRIFTRKNQYRELPEKNASDWKELLKPDIVQWEQAREAAKGGPRVLVATSVGGHGAITPVESLLAVALTLRGAEVHFLLCDEFLPACMQVTIGQFSDRDEFVEHGPAKSLCSTCFAAGLAAYQPLGLPIHRYSQYVTSDELENVESLSTDITLAEIPDYCLDGVAVGEHALAGALRYFARGTLDGEPTAEPVLRRYFKASLLTTYAMRRLFEAYEFETASFNHGIYVPQGLIGEVARQQGVWMSTWSPAYRKHCFIFSHGDTYHHTLMKEPNEVWEDMEWTAEIEEQIMDYLKSRWYGTQDWIWFHENPQEDLAKISSELGIDFSKPTIGLLTNVMWDAQLHYPANAFPNMLSWVLQTIEYFSEHPDLQLVIRVHPAEIRGTLPSRQKIVDEVAKAFPVLPPNVFVIPPESNVSTYAVMLRCDSVIIYGTKTGVELTSFGIPVIVAGEAWIRNKGVTMDARSAAGYFQILDRLPFGHRLDEGMTRRARMYAYHFFFRRMIPLPMIEPMSGWPPYRVAIQSLDDLRPGADPGLDVICEGILNGTPFVFSAERQLHGEKLAEKV